jgi:hypothetical protein
MEVLEKITKAEKNLRLCLFKLLRLLALSADERHQTEATKAGQGDG